MTPRDTPRATRRESARRLLSMLKPLAPMMAVSSTCRVVNQTLGVAIPAVAAAGVARIMDGESVGALVWTLAVLALVKGLFRYLEQFTGHAVAFRLLATLRVDTYRHIEPLAPAGLEADRTGDLVSRVVGDVDRVEPFYAHTIAPIVGALIVPGLAAAGLALWVDPVVAIVFWPFAVAIAVAAPFVRAPTVARLSAAAREVSGEAAAILTDAVQGAREVAVLDAADVIADRMAAAAAHSDGIRRRLSRIGAVRAFAMDLLAGAAVVAVGLVGLARFDGGAIDIAGLTAALVVAWVGTGPARALEDVVPDVEQAVAAAGRLFELADRRPVVRPTDTPSPKPDSGAVGFRDVGLRLGDSTVLSSVTLDVPDRSMVALVGPSGSGKSTLVELLVRFRDPDGGAVTVGGTDVRHLSDRDRRQIVALVPQRPDLFHGTIADNLRLAAPHATDDDLWAVLDRAALASWVRGLEDGLEASVGELGEMMSGGQRQRLSLARALLRPSSVLVLDEATSDLDRETEARLFQEIADEATRRTVIFVAHRLDSVVGADRILVLDQGRLSEDGTHDELLALDGVYAGLWRRHADDLDA